MITNQEHRIMINSFLAAVSGETAWNYDYSSHVPSEVFSAMDFSKIQAADEHGLFYLKRDGFSVPHYFFCWCNDGGFNMYHRR